MQKRSILFLTNAYPDFESSYRGIFIKKMASLLQEEGYQISVVTPKIYRGSLYFEEQDGIKVYRFPFFARDKLLIEHKQIPYLRMVLYFITGSLLTTYAVLKNRCNLIHVHWAIPTGLIGGLIKTIIKKPLIVTIHGSDLRMAIEKAGILKKLFIWVCKRADYLHCVSEVQKKEIEQLGITNQKILTIPMGIGEAFLEVREKRKIKGEKDHITVLSNRNLHSIYNVSLLIRAIPLILKEEPELKFVIAGDGPERTKLENEAKRFNVNSSVKFLGRVPHEEMPDLWSNADIYVSTSLYDGASVSLLEAMASGAFPIVTDIPANREWITTGRNGFLVPVDEEKCLADRIIDAIRNQALLEKSRMVNLSIVEEKALWSVIIEKIKRMYHETLDLGTS